MYTPSDDSIGSNPFWDYSIAVYAKDGVASCCLALQDGFGIDVNLLLYAAWLAQSGRRLSPSHLREVHSRITDWREHVIHPLRTLRQQLRAFPPAADIRDGIKALELHAEQQQQSMMYICYQRAGELPLVENPLQQNLELVAKAASPTDDGWVADVQCLIPLLSS